MYALFTELDSSKIWYPDQYCDQPLCIIGHGISHSMALVTGFVKEKFGHMLVVIWLRFSYMRLIRV